MRNEERKAGTSAIPYRVLLAAYLAHLLLPLMFLLDSLWAWHASTADISEKAVVPIATMWLILGLGALASTRSRRHFLDRVSGVLIAIYVICFSVALLELGLRVTIGHLNRNTFRFPPGTKHVSHNLARWGLPGVPATAVFSTNELGLRGPTLPREGRVYKIITVGGSTPECFALDDSQEWPHLPMQAMNERQKEYSVWVGNAGVGGLTTVDHLACFYKRPVLSEADLLIFLIGINDLGVTLISGGAPSQNLLEYRAELILHHAPRERAGGRLFPPVLAVHAGPDRTAQPGLKPQEALVLDPGIRRCSGRKGGPCQGTDRAPP
jgi:hypothetical protein